MRKIFIGIDPGLSGGIAGIIIEDGVCTLADVFPMPIIKEKKGKKTKSKIAMPGLLKILMGAICDDVYGVYIGLNNLFGYTAICTETELYFYLEKSQAMPKQGVVGVFNYGRGYGKILGLLEYISSTCESIHLKEISPVSWKRYFELLKKDKIDSIYKAIEFYPQLKEKFFGPRGGKRDGLAEALLMARYAACKEWREKL